MKIRFDFVTNSSSTSFVIISKGKPDKEIFLKAMGVEKNSPLKPFFEELFEVLDWKIKNAKDAIKSTYWGPKKDVQTLIKDEISHFAANKAKEALKSGQDIWIGTLKSDGGTVESFFCCDSFEIDNKNLYFNGLRCGW